MFQAGDGLGEELAKRYAEAWSNLPAVTRAALKTCDVTLDREHVHALIQAPHPLVTLTYWLRTDGVPGRRARQGHPDKSR